MNLDVIIGYLDLQEGDKYPEANFFMMGTIEEDILEGKKLKNFPNFNDKKNLEEFLLKKINKQTNEKSFNVLFVPLPKTFE